VANIAAVLWAASCFTWFFLCAFCLQRVLGYNAVLASAASARTGQLSLSGVDPTVALNGGYHVAFALGAGCALIAAACCAFLLPCGKRGQALDAGDRWRVCLDLP